MTRRIPNVVILGLILTAPTFSSEDAVARPTPDLPPEVREMLPQPFRPAPNPQPEAVRGQAVDWAALIDSTWGPSPWTQAQRISIFDDFWNTIQTQNACFQDIPVDWVALRNQYRAEATDTTISAGRLHAILTQLVRELQDGHTFVIDQNVSSTTPSPGVPLFVRGVWADNTRFGASVTPLPDGTGLVYEVVPGHPLGLAPGDRLLGYDGQPWSKLARELIDVHRLPITGHYWGGDDDGFQHVLVGSVGMNWHLFDRLDVLKHSTGELQHLSTAPLGGLTTSLFSTEQLRIPGLPRHDISSQKCVDWGLVPGTNIGYVTVLAWQNQFSGVCFPGAGTEFLQAIDELTQQMSTDGLIIDFRFNLGGDMFLSNDALELLFLQTTPTIDFVNRCGDPNDPLDLCPMNNSAFYNIPGNPATSYMKPIAVLDGPATISSGDQVSLRFDFLPQAKSFGKSTSTTFNGPTPLTWTDPVVASTYIGRFCSADAYLLSNPGEYLTHDEQSIDCPVWFEPDDVASGIDTVLQAAVDWIQGNDIDLDGDTRKGACDNCPTVFNPFQADSDLDGAGNDCDCAPNSDLVRPGAVERNDGVDNQCTGDAGFGLVDETSNESGFLVGGSKDEYAWVGQQGASGYDVARAPTADFSVGCQLFSTVETSLIDPDIPALGVVYYYLNRPSAPNTGSWGQTSAELERIFGCP